MTIAPTPRTLPLLLAVIMAAALADAASNRLNDPDVGVAADRSFVAEKDMPATRRMVRVIARLEDIAASCQGYVVDKAALQAFVIKHTRSDRLSDYDGADARFGGEVAAAGKRMAAAGEANASRCDEAAQLALTPGADGMTLIRRSALDAARK